MTGEWGGPGLDSDVRRTVTPHAETHLPAGEDPIPLTLWDLAPIGMVMLWKGDLADVPPGWNVIADDRFIVGAGGALAVGDEGGSNTHTHDGHGVDNTGATGAVQWTFLDDGDALHSTEDHRPPYHAIYILQKVF